jgi:hypothetical protein
MSNRFILAKQIDSLLLDIEQLLQSANSAEQLTQLAISMSVLDNIGRLEKTIQKEMMQLNDKLLSRKRSYSRHSKHSTTHQSSGPR